MKIFVLHYSKLIERKQNILEQFKRHNITDYEFIELFDKDSILDRYKNLFVPKYRLSMVSLILKHFWVYKEISIKYDCALILEDDAILADNFVEILDKYMAELPADYDMLFIGNGCNLHIPNIPDKYIYEKCLHPTSWGGDGASRCSDSYIVNKKCAIKLNEYISHLNYKINISSDFWINKAARDNNLKVYWSEPTIVSQGTENGLFKTSII
jgi:hypothetical protein